MPLPIQTFDQIVNNQINAMQANSQAILNFDDGSVLKALIQSNAANSIWLQALATTLLAVTRLSTSAGTDVDTFIADFGFSRFQGSAANGNVTFSRFTTTVQGVVPVGTIISDSQDNLTFTVTQDTSNPNYNAGMNAYVVAISTASMTVPCVCNVVGTVGNVAIGAIDTINNPATTPGIDTVTNAAAFITGQDPWSDSLTKTNFALYIQSLSRATMQAIQFAVGTVNIGSERVVRYNVVENVNESGSPQLGYFYVVIDNGTGSPPSDALKTATINQVENYRGLTIQFNVDKTLITTPTISVSINLIAQPTETNTVIKNNIIAALQAYAASIPFNQPFLYNMISQIVLDADPNVLNIPTTGGNNPMLNGGNSDVAGDNLHVFYLPTANITINIL